MCGRFTLHTEQEILARRFRVGSEELSALEPRYNIAPTQPILTVHVARDGLRLTEMRWGLIPPGARDVSKLPPMINARSETAATRRPFRHPFRRQRCLILADGFYEWGPAGVSREARSPFWISLASREPFAMAGLWTAWRPPGEEPEGGLRLTCTILTAPANAAVERVHDRMPVILHPEAEEAYLNPGLSDVASVLRLLEPVPADALHLVPVSRRVNSPKNDGPELIHAVPEPPTLGF